VAHLQGPPSNFLFALMLAYRCPTVGNFSCV
jgi:hypothetical protein